LKHCATSRKVAGFILGDVTGIFHWHNPCRKLHNEELYDLHSPTNIIWVIKSRKMRWAVNVASMGGGEMYREFWWGNLRGRGHLEDPDVDGRIMR